MGHGLCAGWTDSPKVAAVLALSPEWIETTFPVELRGWGVGGRGEGGQGEGGGRGEGSLSSCVMILMQIAYCSNDGMKREMGWSFGEGGVGGGGGRGIGGGRGQRQG